MQEIIIKMIYGLTRVFKLNSTEFILLKKNYAQSQWFLFQQAVIKHQDDAFRILEKLFETTSQKNEWA